MFNEYMHYNFDFVLGLCTFLTLLVIFASPNKLYKDMFPIERLSNSWKKSPVENILHLNNSNLNCSSVNRIEMINFDWQHISGCDCTNIHENYTYHVNHSQKYEDDVFEGLCNKKQTEIGCRSIDKSSLIKANIWKKVKLCYTTAANTNYFSFYKVKSNENCPYDYPKKCGKFDTLNHTMCLKSHENCPINYLGFKSRFNEIILKPDFNNTNTDYGTIYSDFAVLDGLPCINFNEVENNEINQYILSFDKKRSKCLSHVIKSDEKIYHDMRLSVVDEYSKQQFYDENGILKYIYHLPNYPIIRNKMVKFYAGIYIGWDSNCDEGEGGQNILEKINEFNLFIAKSIESRKAMILVIILISLIYIGGISLFKYKKVSNLVTINKENSEILVSVYCLLFFFNILLFSFINNLEKFCSETSVNRLMETIFTTSCSDHITNFLLKDFAAKYFAFFKRLYFIKYLCFIAFIPCVLMIFYIKPGEDKKRGLKNR